MQLLPVKRSSGTTVNEDVEDQGTQKDQPDDRRNCNKRSSRQNWQGRGRQSESRAARVNDSTQEASGQGGGAANVQADLVKDLVKQNADIVKQNADIVRQNADKDNEIRELYRQKEELQRALARKESVEAARALVPILWCPPCSRLDR